jgi:putative membrane protein
MWPYMGSMGWWMVLWWIVVIVVLVLLVRVAAGALGSAPRNDETPEQILKRRYAKGEIDREEYQRRLEDLRR